FEPSGARSRPTLDEDANNPAGSRNIASPMLVTMPSLVRTGPLRRYTVTSDQLKFLTLNTISSGPYRTEATSWLGEEAHAPNPASSRPRANLWRRWRCI